MPSATKITIPPIIAGVPREVVWATPVDVNRASGAGTYRLLNTAFWNPFVLHDLVEVRRKGTALNVVGLLEASACAAYAVTFWPECDREDVDELLAEWTASGTWIEGDGAGGYIVTTAPESEQRPTEAELEERTYRYNLQYDPVREPGLDLTVWPPRLQRPA